MRHYRRGPISGIPIPLAHPRGHGQRGQGVPHGRHRQDGHHVPLVRDPYRPVSPGGHQPAPGQAGRVLLVLPEARLVGVRAPDGDDARARGPRGAGPRLRRPGRRHDEVRERPQALLCGPRRPTRAHDGGDAGPAAGAFRRGRPLQAADDHGAGEHPRALARTSLRAAPEPRLFPERLRRAHRNTRDPGGPGGARRCGQPLRYFRLGQRALDRGVPAVPCRGLAARHPPHRLARGLRRGAVLLRAAHRAAVARHVGRPLDADRPHRRQLHQHRHGEAVRPRRA